MSENQGRHVFHLSWLVLGLLQLLSLAGCGRGGGETSDSLLSAGSVESHETEQAAGIRPSPPIRISRGFFGSALAGEIRVQGAAAPAPVTWSEQQPSEPAPVPGTVLADFRDHLGCASLESAGSLQLCFNLMGDVDSVGLNENEMTLNGLGPYLEHRLARPCPGATWSAHLARAARLPAAGTSSSATSFTASYLIQPEGGEGSCDRQPVQVDITIKRP